MWRAVFADISKEAIGLGFLALALFYYSQDGAGPSFSATGSPVSVAHADSMMRKRSVDNCLVAARGYEAAAIDLATDSARAAKLKVKAADALVCAMRVRGHGNILLLDSTLDTPSNKRFWGEHGTVALRLIREARAADHALARDAAAAVIEMDAFMYSSSSKGILRQAVTGAGNEYQRLANGIIARHPSFDSGVGHCYMGGFYAVAPWPLGDRKKAVAKMRAALALEKRSRRNNYYACVTLMQDGQAAAAVEHCEAALRARCLSVSEEDVCDFLTEQVRTVLTKARLAASKA